MKAQGQSLKVGSVLFSKSVPLNALQMKQITCSKTHLIIDVGDYNRQHWNLIFPFISSINSDQLILWHNCEPAMLKEIIHIGFPLLTFITLERNNIRNIEAVVKLNAPNLYKFNLGKNQIVQIRSFRKSRLPKVSTIDLKQNYVFSLEYIPEMDAKELRQLIHTVTPFQTRTRDHVRTLRRPRSRSSQISSHSVQVRKFNTIHAGFQEMQLNQIW